MGAARTFLPSLAGVLVLVATTGWAVAQGGGDTNWLTQPAPGAANAGGGDRGGQPVPGASGWNVRQDGQTSIYTKNPASGSSGGQTGGQTGGQGGTGGGNAGTPAPGTNGWNVRPGDNGTMIYTPSGSKGSAWTPPGLPTASPSGSSGSGSTGSGSQSSGGSTGNATPTTAPSGSGSTGGGTADGSGDLMDGQNHPVPGKPDWQVRWDPTTQQSVYTKVPSSSGGTAGTGASPPPPVTHEEEGGWVADKAGKTKVVYIKDAQGNVVGGYYANYDAKGNLIDKQPFNGTGAPSASDQPTQADLQGTYQGSFTGGASGSVTLHVSGAVVAGSIRGQKDGDPLHAQLSGSVDASGNFAANVSGTVEWEKGVPFTGHMSGRLGKSSASGSWTGSGGLSKSAGSWTAAK